MTLSGLFAVLAFIYLRHLSLITKQDILLIPLHNHPKLQSALFYFFVPQSQKKK